MAAAEWAKRQSAKAQAERKAKLAKSVVAAAHILRNASKVLLEKPPRRAWGRAASGAPPREEAPAETER